MERQGLYRSRKGRVFGGVAGGIANSLNADPAIIRLIFAILIIVGGGGLLLYLILWIAIPEEPFEYFQAGQPDPGSGVTQDAGATDGTPYQPAVYPAKRNSGALIGGLILIAIGALFLIQRFLPQIRFHFHDIWPIIIVIAGLALIMSSFTRNNKS